MSDYQVTVGGDFQELLRGFQQLEARAQQAGQTVGKGLQEGIAKVDDEIEKLKARIRDIRQTQATFKADSSEYKQAERDAMALLRQIGELKKQRVALSADPSSLVALRGQLASLQRELEQVAIGSQRFRELQAAIRATEREMDRFNDTGDDLTILQGAIAGVGFALTNTVVGSAGQAIAALRGLVGQFASLDTELRKAAAAGGEAGGYERLSKVVNEVGIEAAGTTQEVAQLTTELIRGGMTIDQARASLASIVRGAEATGTAFDQMGSVVSASIKGFGLQATDAGRVVDALVQGANASATSVTGLGMAFKYAAPVARILGVSVEELATAAGLLTNAGIDASEAGVTLRNGLSKLGSAAPQAGGAMRDMTGQAAMAAKVVKQLGLDIFETDGTLKPMETTLLRLKAAFNGLDPATKIRMAANLFGGEDDGTKWLALLNQSEEEISKMATTMANSAGATDTARDAMQGFELKVKQLEGTVGSITNTFAALTAGALIPLLDAANTLAGAVSALPEPVKNTAAALILMTGATVGATAAYLILQRAMQLDLTQKAIGEILSLGRALTTTLAGGVAATAAQLPRLRAAIIAVSTLPVTFAPFLEAVKIGIVGGATTGIGAIKGLQAAITSGALLNGIKALAIGAKGLLVAFGPLAVAIGLTVAAVQLWRDQFSGADAVSKSFAASQKAIDESAKKLGVTLGENIIKGERTRNVFEELIRQAREARSLERMGQEVDKVRRTLDGSTEAARKFYQQLGSGAAVTDQQRQAARAVAQELNNQAEAARGLAAQQRGLATEADAAGNTALAASYRSAANEAESNARALAAWASAIGVKVGLTRQEIAATNEATEAERRRLAVAKLATSEKQVQIAESQASGAITEREARTAARLVELEAARNELAAQRRKLDVATPGSDEALAAQQQILDLRGRIADLQIQGSREELSRSQETVAVARELLSVTQTRIDLETQAGAQLKARLQAQRDFLNAVLGLQDAQARLTASEFGVESARQNAAITGAERHLQLMRDRGASAGAIAQQERYIAGLRREMEAIERRALAAQIEAAGQRFQTERQVLAFKQAQEIIDARAAQAAARRNVLEQRQKLLELQQQAMDPSLSAEQSAILQQRINLQQQSLGLAQQQARDEAARIPVLAAIQSLERQTLGAQQQATANGLRAQAATRGWEQSLAGPLNRLDDAVSSSQQLGRALQSVTVGTITAGGETITLKQNVAAVQDATQASASAAYGMAAGFDAANASATKLLGTLRQVASVPQARWSGGPVDAGTSYRVNELGQEALLSPGGALSLINAPARSLWRAPSSGTVIPAGITAGLKAAGMFGGSGRAVVAGGGGSAGAGKLQQAIDRLSARMDALVAKNWDVRVTAPSNAGLLRTVAGF